ncbi:MAG: ABC transporter ATP-binding protein, partial [Candidatus Zixiibacteriota bacterium]
MHVITVEHLTKMYFGGRRGNIVALDDVTLTVEQGEVFGLLGPNGAGKTTFLKVLLGITQKNSGKVTLNGYRAGDLRSRQKVGYLPENHRFPDHLTGLGLLELTGRLCSMASADIESRSEQLLELVGMDRWGGTRIRKYSKGMLQRVGLAQALVNDPDVLLLDEPTDGVDPVGKAEIREVLLRVRNEGKTIVLNSHLLSEVEAVADRVAILSRGKLVRISSVEALTTRSSHYEIEADIGSNVIEISPEVGRILSIAANRLIVELTSSEQVNQVIDQLRLKRINILSVKPMKVSLEQSFLETISAAGESRP